MYEMRFDKFYYQVLITKSKYDIYVTMEAAAKYNFSLSIYVFGRIL